MRRSRIKAKPNIGPKAGGGPKPGARSESKPASQAPVPEQSKPEDEVGKKEEPAAIEEMEESSVVKIASPKVVTVSPEKSVVKEVTPTAPATPIALSGADAPNTPTATPNTPATSPKPGFTTPLTRLQPANETQRSLTELRNTPSGTPTLKIADKNTTDPKPRIVNRFGKVKPKPNLTIRSRRPSVSENDEERKSASNPAPATPRAAQILTEKEATPTTLAPLSPIRHRGSLDPPPDTPNGGPREPPGSPVRHRGAAMEVLDAFPTPVAEEELVKKPRRRRPHKVVWGDEPPDKTKLTMKDLIYWNPKRNRMKPKEDKKKKAETEEDKDAEADDQEEDVESVTGEEARAPTPVPQVKIGPDGSIILNEESMVVDTTLPTMDDTVIDGDLVHETDSDVNYFSFRKDSHRSKRWTMKETLRFYKALSVVGTDFTLIKQIFKTRSRKEIKAKWKREERENRHLIDKALKEHITDFDMKIFNESEEEELAPAEKPKKRRGRRKVLEEEEEDVVDAEAEVVARAKRRSRRRKTDSRTPTPTPTLEPIPTPTDIPPTSDVITPRVTPPRAPPTGILTFTPNNVNAALNTTNKPSFVYQSPTLASTSSMTSPPVMTSPLDPGSSRLTIPLPGVQGELVIVKGGNQNPDQQELVHIYMISPPGAKAPAPSGSPLAGIPDTALQAIQSFIKPIGSNQPNQFPADAGNYSGAHNTSAQDSIQSSDMGTLDHIGSPPPSMMRSPPGRQVDMVSSPLVGPLPRLTDQSPFRIPGRSPVRVDEQSVFQPLQRENSEPSHDETLDNNLNDEQLMNPEQFLHWGELPDDLDDTRGHDYRTREDDEVAGVSQAFIPGPHRGRFVPGNRYRDRNRRLIGRRYGRAYRGPRYRPPTRSPTHRFTINRTKIVNPRLNSTHPVNFEPLLGHQEREAPWRSQVGQEEMHPESENLKKDGGFRMPPRKKRLTWAEGWRPRGFWQKIRRKMRERFLRKKYGSDYMPPTPGFDYSSFNRNVAVRQRSISQSTDRSSPRRVMTTPTLKSKEFQLRCSPPLGQRAMKAHVPNIPTEPRVLTAEVEANVAAELIATESEPKTITDCRPSTSGRGPLVNGKPIGKHRGLVRPQPNLAASVRPLAHRGYLPPSPLVMAPNYPVAETVTVQSADEDESSISTKQKPKLRNKKGPNLVIPKRVRENSESMLSDEETAELVVNVASRLPHPKRAPVFAVIESPPPNIMSPPAAPSLLSPATNLILGPASKSDVKSPVFATAGPSFARSVLPPGQSYVSALSPGQRPATFTSALAMFSPNSPFPTQQDETNFDQNLTALDVNTTATVGAVSDVQSDNVKVSKYEDCTTSGMALPKLSWPDGRCPCTTGSTPTRTTSTVSPARAAKRGKMSTVSSVSDIKSPPPTQRISGHSKQFSAKQASGSKPNEATEQQISPISNTGAVKKADVTSSRGPRSKMSVKPRLTKRAAAVAMETTETDKNEDVKEMKDESEIPRKKARKVDSESQSHESTNSATSNRSEEKAESPGEKLTSQEPVVEAADVIRTSIVTSSAVATKRRPRAKVTPSLPAARRVTPSPAPSEKENETETTPVNQIEDVDKVPNNPDNGAAVDKAVSVTVTTTSSSTESTPRSSDTANAAKRRSRIHAKPALAKARKGGAALLRQATERSALMASSEPSIIQSQSDVVMAECEGGGSDADSVEILEPPVISDEEMAGSRKSSALGPKPLLDINASIATPFVITGTDDDEDGDDDEESSFITIATAAESSTIGTAELSEAPPMDTSSNYPRRSSDILIPSTPTTDEGVEVAMVTTPVAMVTPDDPTDAVTEEEESSFISFRESASSAKSGESDIATDVASTISNAPNTDTPKQVGKQAGVRNRRSTVKVKPKLIPSRGPRKATTVASKQLQLNSDTVPVEHTQTEPVNEPLPISSSEEECSIITIATENDSNALATDSNSIATVPGSIFGVPSASNGAEIDTNEDFEESSCISVVNSVDSECKNEEVAMATSSSAELALSSVLDLTGGLTIQHPETGETIILCQDDT